MALAFAGNGTITGLSVGGLPDGTVDADTLASGAGGKILQIQEARKIDTFTTSSSQTVVDITGLSVNITPSATSSSVLVFGQVNSGASTGDGVMRLYRDSTNIGQATDSGTTPITGITGFGQHRNVYELSTGSFVYLDTAISTTSQVTYKISLFQAGANTWYINRTHSSGGSENERVSSSITVIEIGA